MEVRASLAYWRLCKGKQLFFFVSAAAAFGLVLFCCSQRLCHPLLLQCFPFHRSITPMKSTLLICLEEGVSSSVLTMKTSTLKKLLLYCCVSIEEWLSASQPRERMKNGCMTLCFFTGENMKAPGKSRSSHRARNKRGRARASKDTSKLLLLYDENILERDPLREQKDLAFAQAYLTRVRQSSCPCLGLHQTL